ncbi:MAG: adenylate/guanylate cyclase domain-containing protein [Pseudomonadota bacterium]
MAYSPIKILKQMSDMRDREQEMSKSNSHLAEALEQEKMEGHRIAVIARTVAMTIILCILPIMNPNWDVMYYQATVLLFIALGWLQYRYAQVGYSKFELILIFADILLLTLIFIVPSPFQDEELPTSILYRFNNFAYFFLILALGTLAYSWRTVWAIGTWVAVFWVVGYAGVAFFGHEMPGLGEGSANLYANHELIGSMLDPNGGRFSQRFQEIVIFIIVAAILALRGFRTNQLLMRQAMVAEERANLSRYFPSSLVDAIASTEHDIGAVRSQEVAVLFTDIVGFTQYAERNTPENVMDLLRQYHALIERAIFENGGTLEKYIGDGVMATFGRPETSPEDAANALRCARQIMSANESFNKVREREGKEAVHISIGIHYGAVILGDIGPERRLEFAVVGDTVNVASRLEAESRALEVQCVVSDDLMRQVGEDCPDRESFSMDFRSYGDVQLRGRSQPISVWVT